jgi:hypothetical protein
VHVSLSRLKAFRDFDQGFQTQAIERILGCLDTSSLCKREKIRNGSSCHQHYRGFYHYGAASSDNLESPVGKEAEMGFEWRFHAWDTVRQQLIYVNWDFKLT